jgi:hypothetical protein
MRRLPPLTIGLAAAATAAIIGAIWFAGRGHETKLAARAPEATSTTITASRDRVGDGTTYTPAGTDVAYTVCAEGYGWGRPTLDDQRRHLASLGGEFRQFASDPGLLFDGAYLGRDAAGNIVWDYADFWALVGDPQREQYALARSGLWSATPDSSRCDRRAELTLLTGRVVTGMMLERDVLWITSRDAPGHFEYVSYDTGIADHAVNYRLLDEHGAWIDACCG